MAAESAVTQVSSGMIVGLGTGSTGEFVLLALARRIREGLRITGVPTSEHTASRARELGIPLAELTGPIDIAIDGADEVQRDTLHLIKGRGGALLREKIVAQASARFLVVVDSDQDGRRFGRGTSSRRGRPVWLAGDRSPPSGSRRETRAARLRHRQRQLTFWIASSDPSNRPNLWRAIWTTSPVSSSTACSSEWRPRSTWAPSGVQVLKPLKGVRRHFAPT